MNLTSAVSSLSNRRLCCWVFAVAAATIIALRSGATGLPVFAIYDDSSVGGSSSTSNVSQDTQGLLYFSGPSLLVSDGERWQSASISTSYFIRCVDVDPQGRVWVAAVNELGWFERQADKQWKFRSLLSEIPEKHRQVGQVWRVFADDSGATFISENHILRWNGTQFTIWNMPGTRRLFGTRTKSQVFVHYLLDGLFEVGSSGPRLFIPRKKFDEIGADVAVLWIERRENDWLLGTSYGFFAFDGISFRRFAPEITDFLMTERLTGAARLRDGRIAVGTMKGGIAFVRPDGSLERILSVKDGLPTPYVASLFVGRDGELWMTGSQIVRIDVDQSSLLYGKNSGLPNQPYDKIVKTGNRLFVANESDVFALADDGMKFHRIEGLANRWRVLRSVDQTLWAAGYHGVKRWDEHNVTSVLTNSSDVFALSLPPEGNTEILLGANRDILALQPGAHGPVTIAHVPDVIFSLEKDDSGLIWAGTFGRGVFMVRPTSERPVDAAPAAENMGLPPLSGKTYVRRTTRGDIVVITDNGGWVKRNSEHLFSPIQKFPPGRLAAVSETATDNSIWVAFAISENSPARAGRISIAADGAIWSPHAITALAAIGMPQGIFADTSRGETTLWIAGTGSILKHEITNGLHAPTPRTPLINAFYSDHSGLKVRQPVTAPLPHSVDSVELEFSAVEYSRRDLLRLECRIDGIDDDWRLVNAGAQRELTAVRDGYYSVRVRAVAETGKISPEARLEFRVLPPWWRTKPATAGGLLALAVLIYGIYRLRLRALQRRNAELEQKVHERTEELERASAAKTEFVANMSHDIRNPLNGIVGLTLALEDTRLDSNQRDLVSTLRECTTYLSSLVDDVLDFASIEAGKVELRAAPFTPGELLNSVVTTLKADTAERGASIYVEVDPGLPTHLSGDAGRIQQILVNYVSNALKYAGGDIHVSASIPADAPNEVEFAVTDHGRGISDEDRATLFTKFTRLSGARQAEIKGAGLGLASCRLLADIMSGSVGVESRLGAGARFYLRLPLTAATPAETVATGDLPNTTVLLVEDTDYNALAATAVLRRLGLNCERARTGAEALQLFAAKRFNLVLLDRNLPDMDGIEVARQMRQLETDGLQAIVLAVTAYCTAQDKQLCLDAGMDAFVGKPLTPEKLRKVLLTTGRRLVASATLDVSQDANAAAAPQTSAAPALDTSLLSYLSDGTERGFEHQVERFNTTLAAVKSEVDDAFARRSFAELSVAAHKLLGQARMIGGSPLIEASENLELSARVEDEARCAEHLRRVTAEAAALTEALRHRRPSAATN